MNSEECSIDKDKLMTWYSQFIPLMEQNIRLYEKQRGDILAEIEKYQRLGYVKIGDRTFRFDFKEREKIKDFVLNTMFLADSRDAENKSFENWDNLLVVLDRRIARLRALSASCRSFILKDDQRPNSTNFDSFRGITVHRVLEFYGIPVTKNFAKCPLHQEKTASFKVYPGTNSWYCFGCGKGGDAITLVSAIEKKPIKDIIQLLQKLL